MKLGGLFLAMLMAQSAVWAQMQCQSAQPSLTTEANSEQARLSYLWAQALQNDSIFAAARFQHAAEAQAPALAAAALRPSVALTTQRGETSLGLQSLNPANSGGFQYQPRSTNLRLSMPLYDRERWLTLDEAQIRSQRAEVVLQQEQSELLLRLVNAYANNVLAHETVQLAQSQLQSLNTQAERAQRLFKAGQATLTDVEETSARKALAEAQLTQAKLSISVRRAELERITGPLNNFKPVSLEQQMPVSVVQTDLKPLLEELPKSNFSILAQTFALRAVQLQLQRAQAGHFPVLNLRANRSLSREGSYSTRRESERQIAIDLNIPIYEGGRVSASVRQQSALLEKAQADLSTASGDAEMKLREAHAGLLGAAAQIAALEKAVRSGEITLQGMLAGQQVGLRTNTDVLNAQQQLFSSCRDLVRDRLSKYVADLQLQITLGRSVRF